jgi:acyl carrier protein phosphodiesterase
MNYLAHLYFAQKTPGSHLGSLMPDFSGMSAEEATLRFGRDVGEAVQLHRAIDMFTDTHSVVASCAHHLFPRHRHYSRVIIDIVFDYFLSKHWTAFSDVHLDDFSEKAYQHLSTVTSSYPSRFYTFAQRFCEYRVIEAYATVDGIADVLSRVGMRIKRENSLAVAGEDVRMFYAEIEKGFLEFFPDVCDFVNTKKSILW